jgi:hypothetical protein
MKLLDQEAGVEENASKLVKKNEENMQISVRGP